MQKQYINLDLKEEELIKTQDYLLAVFKIIPKDGYGLLDVASEVASESSSGSNITIGTLTEFSKTCDALVYKINEKDQLAWIAYPVKIFDRGGNVQNIFTYIAGNIFGMSSLAGLKLLDIYIPHNMQKNFIGPTTNIDDMRKFLNVYNRPILGTIIKPKIGLLPNEFAEACYDFWVGGGDFVKFDEPQADQEFSPFKEVITKISSKLKQVEDETGKKKIISVNVSAGDFDTMIERAEFVQKNLEKGSFAFLVDGITTGFTAVQTMARRYPDVFIHFHRAGHGAFTRKENPFGFSVEVLIKFARLAGASGIHTGTAGVGKMSDDVYESIDQYFDEVKVNGQIIKNARFTPIDEALGKTSAGYFFMDEWENMKPITPIASGGLNPIKLNELITKLQVVDFITTMGAGVHSHPDGTRAGATALVQSCEAWQQKVPLEEYAKTHKELERAIEKYK